MKLIKTFLILTIFLTITIPSKESNLFVQKNSHNFFIENKGQWSKEVKYLARIGGMNAWITDFGIVYDYYKIIKNYNVNELSKIPLYEKEKFESGHTSIKGHIIKSVFINRSYNQSYITKGKKETYFNYFIGNDKSKCASFVPLYEGVTVKEIYNGIDIKYYFDKNLLRYDFIVKPGADISQINIGFEGTDDLNVTDKG